MCHEILPYNVKNQCATTNRLSLWIIVFCNKIIVTRLFSFLGHRICPDINTKYNNYARKTHSFCTIHLWSCLHKVAVSSPQGNEEKFSFLHDSCPVPTTNALECRNVSILHSNHRHVRPLMWPPSGWQQQ